MYDPEKPIAICLKKYHTILIIWTKERRFWLIWFVSTILQWYVTYLIILKDAYGGCYVKYIVIITQG